MMVLLKRLSWAILALCCTSAILNAQSAHGPTSNSRSMSDGVAAADHIVTNRPTVNETLHLVDHVSIVVTSGSHLHVATVQDSITITDPTHFTATMIAGNGESLQLVDSIAVLGIHSANLGEGITTLDVIASSTNGSSKTRTVIDSLSFADSVAVVGKHVGPISEGVTMADALAGAKNASHPTAIADGATLGDAVAALAVHNPAPGDSLALLDQVSVSTSISRNNYDAEAGDTLALADSVAVVVRPGGKKKVVVAS